MTAGGDSLFDDDRPGQPVRLARALARPAPAGHHDELRARTVPAGLAGAAAGDLPLAPHWERFFDSLGPDGFLDLDRRQGSLRRQVRDNGITYNVYADADGPQRPWSLDLFPLMLTAKEWAHIEAGVTQRAALLEAVVADVYGPRRLLRAGLLPAAPVLGHPGYLRGMGGVQPAAGRWLHIAAFDLARGPDGLWWVVSQRTQAPSGLGYLLENRLIISRLFAEAFSSLRVQRLAAAYSALLDGLRAACAPVAQPRIVLLTPGPYNETYFEQAYLARYLGLTLVEGGDLTVRDARLYLKTLRGLEPVHGVLRRLDDEWLDPLELRPDSRLGVPGLMQAVRAGHVMMANAPGTAFLETPALLGFLPALARELLGEELRLPALTTWWCGERAAMDAALPLLDGGVIKPTWPGVPVPAPGQTLDRRARDEWAGRILREGDAFTVQARLPLSQLPTWRHQRIEPRAVMLRVYALRDGAGHWRALPGGLARLASGTSHVVSMQSGGSSADVWVMTDGEVDTTTLLRPGTRTPVLARPERTVSSRAAENLFWLGRYTERAENATRLARLTLETLNGEDQGDLPLLTWLSRLAVWQGLVLPDVPPAQQARRVFERSLVAALDDERLGTSVGHSLRALKRAAAAVRERLSLEHWHLIERAEAEFSAQCARALADGEFSSVEAIEALELLGQHTAAMTGAQTDRMSRDDGWRLLSSGRHIERLGFLAQALSDALALGVLADDAGYEAVLALFDSTISFHTRHQQRHDLPALVDLLVLDRDSPRALAWVAQTLRGRLAKLESGDAQPALTPLVPDPDAWDAAALLDAAGGEAALSALLQQCTNAAWTLSDRLGARFFQHAYDSSRSFGT